jgi:hypothetical protein
MGCEVEIPAESVAVAWWKYLKILVFCRFLRALRKWLGGRGSLPALSETSMKTGLFSGTRNSGFASVMTLEMSLVVKGFPSPSRALRRRDKVAGLTYQASIGRTSTYAPQRIRRTPATRPRCGTCGVSFSTRTNAAIVATHTRFITPTTNNSAISAQQQPTQ